MLEVLTSHDDIVEQTFDIDWQSSLPSDLQKYILIILNLFSITSCITERVHLF